MSDSSLPLSIISSSSLTIVDCRTTSPLGRLFAISTGSTIVDSTTSTAPLGVVGNNDKKLFRLVCFTREGQKTILIYIIPMCSQVYNDEK